MRHIKSIDCPDLTHQIVASGGVQEEVNHWQEVRKSYVKEGDLTPTYKGEIVDGRLIIAPISKEAQTN